jgi:hypothetical protein
MYAAAGWLLLCAAAHATAHVWLFVLENEFYGLREFAMNAMKQAESLDPLRPSMWRQFRMFSVGFGLLMVFGGVTGLLMAGERTPDETRRAYALTGTVFWTVAFGLFAFVDPVLQAILVSAVAVPLHAIAYVTAERAAEQPVEGTE